MCFNCKNTELILCSQLKIISAKKYIKLLFLVLRPRKELSMNKLFGRKQAEFI